MKYLVAFWILLAGITAVLAGCQMETVNVTIQGGSGSGLHDKKHAKVWYDGHYAEADNIYIIKIDRSPVNMKQDQEDVANPDIDASGV